MSIREMVQSAEKALVRGEIREARALLALAKKYLQNNDPTGKAEIVALCCFAVDGNGIIHCGKNRVLFPGTKEERIELCLKCRQWCRKQIAVLEEQLSKC